MKTLVNFVVVIILIITSKIWEGWLTAIVPYIPFSFSCLFVLIILIAAAPIVIIAVTIITVCVRARPTRKFIESWKAEEKEKKIQTS